MEALFNICKFSKKKQETAVHHGALPYLIEYATSERGLTGELSLMLLFRMGTECRSREVYQKLWENRGVYVFLSLARTSGWEENSLRSIQVWLSDEKDRVQRILSEPASVQILCDLFGTSSPSVFRLILDSVLGMTKVCSK